MNNMPDLKKSIIDTEEVKVILPIGPRFLVIQGLNIKPKLP